jgi:hypothetical protein
MKLVRLAASLLVGVAFAGLQWALIFKEHSPVNRFDIVPYRAAATLFAMPGMFTAMAAGGNVHSYSSAVVVAANVIFYALITYGLMSLWDKCRFAVHTRNRM